MDMSKPFFLLGRYRHYKGNEYQAIELACHSETKEWLVVYRCLYGDYSLWVRPYSMFIEEVLVDQQLIPRFRFIEAMDDEFMITSINKNPKGEAS